MPTNVSTPIWQCDICLTQFGPDADQAHLCESAGQPQDVPDGTVLLTRTPQQQFVLTRMHPTKTIETDIRWSGTTPGHHRLYSTDHLPAARYSDKELAPLLAGYLHTGRGNAGTHSAFDDKATEKFPLWPATLFGMPALNAPRAGGGWRGYVGRNTYSTWVDPITPPIRALFDALDVSVETGPRWNSDTEMASYELGLNGANAPRTNAALALGDPVARLAAMDALQLAWFAGGDVRAPAPRLTSRSTRTSSKLTKQLKELVEAAGVPWETRTSASEYVNTVVRKKLMTTTPADIRLFAGPKIVAVGSVKGGVGKSTTAAALGAALAATGARVTVLDLDLSGPSQHILWNLGPVPVDVESMRIQPTPTSVENLSVFSHGQLAGGLPGRWSDATSAEWVTFLGSTLDVTETDILVLDMPPGRGFMDDLVLGYGHQLQVDLAVHVTTADPLSLADVRRGLPRDMHARHDRILVETLSRAVGTTADGQQVEVRLTGGEQDVLDLAKEFGIAYGGSLPWAANVTALAASAEVAILAGTVLAAVREDAGER